jgi:hypothetical protein
MSAIAQPQHRKDIDLRRWSSTSHDDARPNEEPGPQIMPQSSSSDLVVNHQTEQLEQLSPSNAIIHCARSHHAQSDTPPAAVKSP